MSFVVTVLLISSYGQVCALALAVGKGVANEAAFKNRLHHSTQSMMDDAIAERSCRHQSLFWFIHLDRYIAAGTVCLIMQQVFKLSNSVSRLAKKDAAPGF